MAYSHDSRIIFLVWQFADDIDAISTAYHFRVGPGVIDRDADMILLEGMIDVDDARITHIRTVLLKGKAHDDDLGTQHLDALFQHQFDGLVGHVCPHPVVHAAPCQDNLRVIAQTLGALSQIVGVNRDAVSTYQARIHFDEVPFGACSLQDILRVDAQQAADLRELVDEGDVDVALGIFYDLSSLCHLDTGSTVGSVLKHGVINIINEFGCLRR